MTHAADNPPPIEPLSALRDEWADIETRRTRQGIEGPAPVQGRPPTNLIGLALSGGGIRSATFNLGVLQALDHVGLLKMFDYVSTVSGGGFIGGWWSA